MKEYLEPSEHIDSQNVDVIEFTHQNKGQNDSLKEQIKSLYLAVRDQIRYDPYHLIMNPELIKASLTLQRGSGYCIEKTLLLAACGRIINVPSRVGFSIVRNHISTEKFRQALRSDLFVFHGYNEFFLNNKWIKCTPAFNKTLCEKFGVTPLEFDAEHDSVFQEYQNGEKYMEYVHEYGTFTDLPYSMFYEELKKYYPHLFQNPENYRVLKDE